MNLISISEIEFFAPRNIKKCWCMQGKSCANSNFIICEKRNENSKSKEEKIENNYVTRHKYRFIEWNVFFEERTAYATGSTNFTAWLNNRNAKGNLKLFRFFNILKKLLAQFFVTMTRWSWINHSTEKTFLIQFYLNSSFSFYRVDFECNRKLNSVVVINMLSSPTFVSIPIFTLSHTEAVEKVLECVCVWFQNEWVMKTKVRVSCAHAMSSE